jgi:primosomal protein N' (replication factor Y)
VVSVLVPVAVAGVYSYRVPKGLDLAPGDIVAVPLGTRLVVGAVWDDPPDGSVGHNRLREVEYRFDTPPLAEAVRRFIDWVANYTLTPRGMVLRMVLRSNAALEPEKPVTALRFTGQLPDRMTPARKKVVDVAGDGKDWNKGALAAAAGVGAGVIDGLIGSRTLVAVEVPPEPIAAEPDAGHRHASLSEAQEDAAKALRDAVAANGFSVALLDGVTGSGKTEVYFEAIAATLAKGGQALVLLPEIALTADFLDRFAWRFGVRPAEWHSDLPPRHRERVWRAVAHGRVRVVAGARSALFLPFPDLRLIVVDEEHDPAYKQDEGVTYHARDMAVARAHLGGFPAILASATPSIESRVNADAGRYARIVLPDRFQQAAMPHIAAVDLRQTPPERGTWLSPPLVAAIGETLEAKQQSLLFLNRRGYAPLTLCRTCGHRMQCPNCSTWLVEHRFRGVLACHHCGFSQPKPRTCPNCDAPDSLTPIGPGVERLNEEVTERFPEARVIILSSDMLGGVQKLREQLGAIRKGEADIIIGTQLVAKGHNFPLLTLVGVVDSDLGLAHGDLRAGERTFQVLSQVTGRAGRLGQASRALLQTYAPDHPVLAALVAGDREAFYAREIAERRAAELPPFVRLAGLIVSGPDRLAVHAYAATLRRSAPQDDSVLLLGPSEAPLALIRGRYRMRFLVRAARSFDLQAYLRSWLENGLPPRAGIRVQVDVDPQSFL